MLLVYRGRSGGCLRLVVEASGGKDDRIYIYRLPGSQRARYTFIDTDILCKCIYTYTQL